MRDYELIEELGQGTYSTVYRARRISDNKVVALKQLKLPPGLDAYQETSLMERFRSEADTARRLNHPHIVSIVDAGEDEGVWFIAFDYVEGKSLQEELAKGGRYTPRRVAAMGRQLSEGLAYAHDNGIIHRDIKPANIIIKPDGSAQISDFGVAIFIGSETRSPEEGIGFVGTPQYSSPEQATASPVDARTDIFSLGAVLYEAAAGQPAFSGNSLGEIIHKITSIQAEPLKHINPSFPPALENVIFKCLAKDSAFRYQAANDLTLALIDAMPEPGVGQDFAPPVKRPPESGEAELIIMSGPTEGQEIKLHPSITTIGRKTGDVTYPDDDTLENQHAWITKEDGGYFLYDAGTAEGTFVAGRRIERTGLNHGDEITLGRQKLMYIGPSAAGVTETRPLRPEDVLPPRKPLVSKKGIALGVPILAAMIIIIILFYIFAFAPTQSAARFDRGLAYLYEAFEASFVQAEISSPDLLLEAARDVELPSFDILDIDLSDPESANSGGTRVVRQTRRDRFEFVTGLYDAVEALRGHDPADVNATILKLSAIAATINRIRIIEIDEEWINRMLAGSAALENFKAILGSPSTPVPTGTSREEAATALYKAYMAYMDGGYQPMQVMNYFYDAESELLKLGANPPDSNFADYNLAVCYYLMGSQLMASIDTHDVSAEFFLEAQTLVSRFRGKSSLTEQLKVTGIEEALYNPSVLTARIDLALDRLQGQVNFEWE